MKVIKKTPNKNWKIGLSVNNGIVSYLDYISHDADVEKVDNFIFEATLLPKDFYRGRSAAGFVFIDADDGSQFTMRISKTEALLKAIVEGKVKVTKQGFKGTYTFAKQGSNYTIMVAEL